LAFAWLHDAWGALGALIALPIMLAVGMGIQREKEAEKIDPFLKKMAISSFLWVLGFGLGLYLFK